MAVINRRRLWIGATVLMVVVLAATAYALRGHLAHAPLVGRLVSAQPVASVSEDPDAIAYWTCPMHPHVKEHGPGKCPECGMDLVPVTNAEAQKMPAADSTQVSGDPAAAATTPASAGTARAEITIDPRRQQLIGVRTVPVERRALTATVRTVGVVRYDETRLADVNLKLEGWVRDLYVDTTGEFVKAGQPLFTLYSPELVTTQNEYLLALKTRDQVRHSQLADAREHADRLVESAKQRLGLWDLPADQFEKLEESRQAQTAIVFRSPVNGYVIEKNALKGQHVTPGQTLYKLADLSTVWVEADLYEGELPRVRIGAPATVTLDAYPGERFSGRVAFIYPFVGEQTRTVKVRFTLANRGARLKPGMYANVELPTSSGRSLVVPTNALLDSGQEQVVFVAQGDGYFEPRRVQVGQRLDDAVEIISGLKEGESVASGAAFFLDSESQLRSSLQAYETAPAAAAGSSASRERLSITFRSQPEPPRSGENQFEAVVKTPDGTPVTDAQVTVVFFMAAMPSMNMPAMRNEATLSHAGNGVYRGTGQVMMAGRWDVTVNVLRDGQRIGSQQVSVVAR
jgi:RND family efflux transporter MFP subunit